MKQNEIKIVEPTNKWKKFLIDVVDIIAFVIFMLWIIIFLKVFVIAFVGVKWSSMLPNYHEWDYIFVDKVYWKHTSWVKRWDVLVLMPPTSNVSYLKRLIWLPNETVEITWWKVYICKTKKDWSTYKWNDINIKNTYKDKNLICKRLIEKYIDGKTVNKRWFPEKIVTKADCGISKFKLGSWQYLVFWDDRMYSTDSRCCFVWTCKWTDAKYYITKDEILWKVIDFKNLFK